MKFLHKSAVQPFLNFNKYLTNNSHKMSTGITFETLTFDNLALKTLPIDKVKENHVRQVKDACFSKIKPTECLNPSMVAYSKHAMSLIDLDQNELERKEAPEYLSGNKLMPGSETAAHCYCGHQFGHFAGQLGDGAAIHLGEVLNKKGERWEIQLKGAGLTPYSRTADGRKVLRSTLREFLCSEAMHFLNIATTRAGSCVMSDSKVVRDIHYDGHPRLENCAIVLRISPTFIRFGSFEAFGPERPFYSNHEISKQLLDYVCDNLFQLKDHESSESKYEKFLEQVVEKTAKLVSDWQCCGFVHGVLNTDNMSILGLTIDYGPYGFLDRYDPDYIFNGSDTGGRYTYRNQPEICEWNLMKLAKALEKIIPLDKSKTLIKENYMKNFKKFYSEQMRKKLGLISIKENDDKLIETLMETMSVTGSDFTNSFRKLSSLNLTGNDRINEDKDIDEFLQIILNECNSIEEKKDAIKPHFKPETLSRLLEAVQENPQILAYYGLSEVFIKNEVSNMEETEKIKDWVAEDKLKNDSDVWKSWLKSYIERIYSEYENTMIDLVTIDKRKDLMNKTNPRFILRNHLAQDAISLIEDKGEKIDAKILLKLLENPFSDEPLNELLAEFSSESEKIIEDRKKSLYYEKSPSIEKCIKLSCSS